MTKQKQLDKGIIEKVKSVDINNSNRNHYIPHYAVITQGKITTKLKQRKGGKARMNVYTGEQNRHLGRPIWIFAKISRK